MKIEVESEALDSLKAMAQRLQDERDTLLEALSISQEILENIDPYEGQEDILAEAVTMNRCLIAKCTKEPEVM